MAVFAKFDGIDGESTEGLYRSIPEGNRDSFEFKDAPEGGAADDRPTEEVAFYYNKIAFGYAPTEDGKEFTKVEWTYADQDDATSDTVPTEELTLGYTEVEWTY